MGHLKSIPAFKYYFPPDMVESIVSDIQRLLSSGDYLTLGRYTEKFERDFSAYIKTKHAIAMSSGTSALEAILRAIDIEGQEVILPTNTFAATAYAVIHAGGRPVFADIQRDLSINPRDVKRRMSPKTKAIIAVHVGGFISPAIKELKRFAKAGGLALLEDAAHAQGSTISGIKAGNLGAAAGFSFFSTKVMTAGEGGMVTTNDDEIASKVRLMRDQGKISGNRVGTVGYNWRMSEFQSIVGNAQLTRLDEMIDARTRVAELYDESLKNEHSVQILRGDKNARPNYYKYIAFPQKGRSPEQLRQLMKRRFGIILSGYVYEAPLHSQGMFDRYVLNRSQYPVADDLCNRHFCLPMYPQMTTEESDYVASSLHEAFKDLGWA